MKEALFSMLTSDSKSITKAGATCIAAIAMIELPTNNWPDLLESL